MRVLVVTLVWTLGLPTAARAAPTQRCRAAADGAGPLLISSQGRPVGSRSGGRIDYRTARGELQGMSAEERALPEFQRIQPDTYARAVGGLANYGLGDLPAEDPFAAKVNDWQRQTGRKRAAVRERIFRAMTAQTGNRDPRTYPISWDDVTFSDVTERETPRGGKIFEHLFHFPTGIMGMHVTGRLFVPESALGKFRRGERSPAVIYEHYHGALQVVGSQELDTNWNYGGLGTPLDMLSELGFIAIATDVHGFHRRRMAEGRTGDPFQRADFQDAYDDTRRMFERGMSPYAVRSFEDYLVLRLIKQHPMVQSDRVAAMGMSMGGVRTWTLAALAGSELRAGVSNGTFPRFYEAVRDDIIKNHLNTHTLLREISQYNLDTEDFLFAAGDANMMLQFGSLDPSSPGHEKLFDFARRFAGSGREIDAEVQPGASHAFTSHQLVKAYAFLARHLLGRDIYQALMRRAFSQGG